MADDERKSPGAVAVASAVEATKGKGGMTFCTGMAVLAVQVPPRVNEWLAGELSPAREGLWVVAAIPVVAGVVWLGFRLAGWKAPKSVKDEALGKQGESPNAG